MPNLLEKMMSHAGTNVVPKAARENTGCRAYVSNSHDFRRIRALPRRRWEEYEYSEVVNAYCKTPNGQMTLRPIQVAALWDIKEQKGAFLPVGVGGGKALISLLAPRMVKAKRPVLFVPANLREQTLQFVIPKMSPHWRLPPIAVASYSELSLEKNAKMLEEYEPDLIILDECHLVANPRSGRTKRLARWFKANPETICVAMSGTISKRSIRDFAHILEWCLGTGSPLPLEWHELSDWADCLDVDVPPTMRVAPGILNKLCKEGENVRQGYQRRFRETPGIIASTESQLGASLRVEQHHLEMPNEVLEKIQQMRSDWVTPDGDIITMGVDLARHAKELALGFFYKWDPPGPREWLEKRAAWKKYVRDTLKHNRRGLDTELQVWNETKKLNPTFTIWTEWVDIKDTFEPNTVAVWVNDFAVVQCIKWLKARRAGDPGICWYEHNAFGERLRDLSGLPFFGRGDSSILKSTHPAIIASRPSHGLGKNLQFYSRNLVVCTPSSGRDWEQMIGRTHRDGQTADTVNFELFLHTEELQASFQRAREDAVYLQDTYGNEQKLNYADVLIP